MGRLGGVVTAVIKRATFEIHCRAGYECLWILFPLDPRPWFSLRDRTISQVRTRLGAALFFAELLIPFQRGRKRLFKLDSDGELNEETLISVFCPPEQCPSSVRDTSV